MPDLGSPLALEVGLTGLMVVVFFAGVFMHGADRRRVGVISVIGLVVLLGVAMRTEPGPALFGGSFVQDELAIFAKRLFLLATVIGALGSLALRAPTFARRATEYHLAILASLLGMLVLASARDLILLFVAFELMSIPPTTWRAFSSARGGGRGGAQVLPGGHRLLRHPRVRAVRFSTGSRRRPTSGSSLGRSRASTRSSCSG
jgi:NADH:ubiquinone oxidoreductase subunit 2 (subunit N)